jgi:hypothetical protein
LPFEFGDGVDVWGNGEDIELGVMCVVSSIEKSLGVRFAGVDAMLLVSMSLRRRMAVLGWSS